MPSISVVYFDAGGGHRNACQAIRAVIAAQSLDWDVQSLNLQACLDSLDPFLQLTGVRVQDLYNLLLERGWTLAARPLLATLHGLIRLYHEPMRKMLCEVWRRQRPDLVLSVIPNFNRVLATSLRETLPGTPFVTLLTDMADYPPHFWIERESQYLICGTGRAVQQALALGHAPERVFCTSGMVLHPRFYAEALPDRGAARRALGLAPDVPTLVVLFGGYGSDVMYDIARRLDRSATELQMILICGRNARLAQRLSRMPRRKKIHVEGFTGRVPHYLAISDLFIGKPGPGSLSEALHFGLPVIVEKNAWTLPQECFNVDWIVEREVGICLRSFRHIAAAVDAMLAPGVLAQFQTSARALPNRAVFEVPEILARILQGDQPLQALVASDSSSSESSLSSSLSSKSNWQG